MVREIIHKRYFKVHLKDHVSWSKLKRSTTTQVKVSANFYEIAQQTHAWLEEMGSRAKTTGAILFAKASKKKQLNSWEIFKI